MARKKKSLRAIRSRLESWESRGILELGQTEALKRALRELEHAGTTRKPKTINKAVEALARLVVEFFL